MRFTNVYTCQITGIAPLFNAPKKYVLKQAVICAALDCAGHYGNNLAASVFFNVCIVNKSPAEFSPPIGGFMELRSNALCPV